MTKSSNASGLMRFLKFMFKSFCALILLVAVGLLTAHFVWKYSGSNQWELVSDQNGVKLYEKKVPGSVRKQLKAVRRLNGTVSAAVSAMLDTDLKTCAEWIPGCSRVQPVETWDEKKRYQIYFWHVDMDAPFPISSREFLLKIQATPEPATKSVLVELTAVPDRLPRNSCCFRIADMHNTWRFTPVGEGQIQVEFTENMDIGLPYVLTNKFSPEGTKYMFNQLPELLNKPQYLDDRFDFIDAMER